MAVDRDTSRDNLLALIYGDPETTDPATLPGLPLEDALARLPELLELIVTDGHRVVLRREGQEPVALVPIGDLEWIQELEDRRDAAAVESALAEGGDPIPWEDVKRELGL